MKIVFFRVKKTWHIFFISYIDMVEKGAYNFNSGQAKIVS